MKINKFQIFMRSLLLQGFWNFSQLQNIGMLYIVYPYLQKLYQDDKILYKRAILRNMEAFNTNPVMSTYSVGAMLKQEESIAKAKGNKIQVHAEEREWHIVKASTAGTAASIGDRLFWSTIKPLSLVLCFTILFLWQVPFINEVHHATFLMVLIVALSASFLFYNIPAWIVRAKGFTAGYNGNEENFYGLININWNKLITVLKTSGQVLTLFVFICGLYLHFRGNPFDAYLITKISLLAAFIVLSIFIKRLNMPNIFLYLSATIVFAIASFLA